jgi:hypothetical protein
MAQSLTSTFHFTVSGFIGTPATAATPFQGQTFTNAAITVTEVANTANRASCCTSGYYILNDSASISIAGIGTFQVTTPTCTFSDPHIDPIKGVVSVEIGFWTCPGNYPTNPTVDLLYPTSSPWDLLSSFGPIQLVQPNFIYTNGSFVTTGGTVQWSTSLGLGQNASTGSFQAIFTGTPPPPALNRVGVLSHVVNGGYWDTKINLINTSSAPVSATVLFRLDDGSAWGLPFTTTQQGTTQTTMANSANITVNPNSTVVIATTSNPSANSVWGWADVQASGPLSGFAILRSTPTGGNPSEATVPLQGSFPSSLILPYDNTAGYVMGVALVNLAPGSANINATIWDDSGNRVGSQPISLAGNGHTAFVLTDQLPATAGKRGIIQFQNPAGGVSGLGLRFSPAGPFTDVPVILQQ